MCLIFLMSALAAAQGGPAPQEAPKALPMFHADSVNKSVDPCVDFYQYACGKWIKDNPIPSDQVVWGTASLLLEHNRAVLHQILEKAAAGDPKRDAVEAKVGDFYAACMDEKGVEAKGAAPLQGELDGIAKMKSVADLPGEVARLHSLGVRTLFDFSSVQDFKDAAQQIAAADQGGLGLPDRDYYLKDDPRSTAIRKAYQAHVSQMFELLGEKPEQADADTATIMKVETALAQASMDRTARRDPAAIYHKMGKKDMMALTPDFAWDRYLADLKVPGFQDVNVVAPDFFKGLEALLKSASLAEWQTYLRWGVVNSAAPYLSSAFVNEDFNFKGKTLTGAKEIQPRWKRCVSLTDRSLGEALGQSYVDAAFPGESKAQTLKMVMALEKALGEDIQGLDWMSEATKQQAMVKLRGIANKIGYPDTWRDYSSVKVERTDLLGNVQRASSFEVHRDLNKIGQPVDHKEWGMTPPTVNAYYNPLMNDINFPAGILQLPFFSKDQPLALNFGGIGAVIGHELTHGFDDEGRKFNAQGNMADWWTDEDGKKFEARASCVADEYSSFSAVKDPSDPAKDVKLNGRLTLGENTADNGGLRIAYMALEDSLKTEPEQSYAGFTPEQLLFLGWGQVWCQNQTEQIAALRVKVDPHSPAQFRVNGVVSNMPEFSKAFSCKKGQPMAPEKQCRVW
jgi:predicted metalloendopeptidase